MEQVNKDNDPIFVGLHAGSLARSCGQFAKSNEFFDLAEHKYKHDVDLENIGKKGAKLITSVVFSDAFNDYDGNMYERIMVNVYKGFNFMSLGDYENARVEFNRAALRQEVAKDISKKVKSVIKEKQKKGEYMCTIPPYGYKKDKLKKNHLIIDKNVVDNVKKIYNMYLSGESIYKIREYLNKNKIQSPNRTIT